MCLQNRSHNQQHRDGTGGLPKICFVSVIPVGYGHTALFINMYLNAQIFMPDNPVVGMLHRLEEQCLVQAKSLVMSFDLAESFDRMYCLRRNILNAVTRP